MMNLMLDKEGVPRKAELVKFLESETKMMMKLSSTSYSQLYVLTHKKKPKQNMTSQYTIKSNCAFH